MLSDIEIANAAELRPITEVAATTLGIATEHLVPYGHTKAKVDLGYLAVLADRPIGRLILMTAISPTPGRRGQDHHHRRAHRRPARARATGRSPACGSRRWARCSG